MLYPGYWDEQTGVKAAGTNERTTCLFPLNWESEICPPETDGSEKPGARWPGFNVVALSTGLLFCGR